MIIDLTMLECMYISETTRFFRCALRQESPEVMQKIAATIMLLEEEQVGQGLLLRIRDHIEQEERADYYHQ